MKFKAIFILFFVNLLCFCHGDQSTPAQNSAPTTVDPNCANNKVDPALLDNPDLGVGGIVIDKPVFSTEGPNGTTHGPGGDPSSTEPQPESSTPTPVTVTAENPTSSSGGQNGSSSIPGSPTVPTGVVSSTPHASSGTDLPGGKPTTDSPHGNSNPTPKEPVTDTSEKPSSPAAGSDAPSPTPGSPTISTGDESSTPIPSSGTDQPGENHTTDSQSEHSNPASPTPREPVTVTAEHPTSPSGGQNESSTIPGSPTVPAGEEPSTPQPSLGTDSPGGSTQYYLSTISALLPTTTSSPCAGALCSIQQVFQQLAAQLMAFLQQIFGPLLEALGITNIG